MTWHFSLFLCIKTWWFWSNGFSIGLMPFEIVQCFIYFKFVNFFTLPIKLLPKKINVIFFLFSTIWSNGPSCPAEGAVVKKRFQNPFANGLHTLLFFHGVKNLIMHLFKRCFYIMDFRAIWNNVLTFDFSLKFTSGGEGSAPPPPAEDAVVNIKYLQQGTGDLSNSYMRRGESVTDGRVLEHHRRRCARTSWLFNEKCFWEGFVICQRHLKENVHALRSFVRAARWRRVIWFEANE